MVSYLKLGATLHGLRWKMERTRSNYDLRGPLYADTRTFMRLNSDQADYALFRLLTRPAKTVSPSYQGIAVLRFEPDGDPAWGRRTKALDDLLMGNEYRLYTQSAMHRIHTIGTRPFAMLADQPFEVSANGQTIRAMADNRSGFFYLLGNTEQLARYSLCSDQVRNLSIAVQVLPAWMSVHNR
jgi:hypothetical protein